MVERGQLRGLMALRYGSMNVDVITCFGVSNYAVLVLSVPEVTMH